MRFENDKNFPELEGMNTYPHTHKAIINYCLSKLRVKKVIGNICSGPMQERLMLELGLSEYDFHA